MIFLGTDRTIEDILDEHVETLQFLWERRGAELRGAGMAARAFADLEERILAHTDALVLAGPDAVLWLEEGLAGDEAAISLASAYALLGMEDIDASRLVLQALRETSGPCLEGLCRALSYSSIDRTAAELREVAASGLVLPASAAAEAVAFHGEGSVAAGRIVEFLKCDQAPVRRAGWRIVALLDGMPGASSAWSPASFEAYEPGLRDEDPKVRQQVLETAAWTRQSWLLDYCRGIATVPSPDRLATIQLLAILGEPYDLDVMLAAGRAPFLGLSRFKVLAAFGHPAVVEVLLEGIGSKDPAVAVAAAAAYARITGADIDSEKRVKLLPLGDSPPDEFETEFLDEVILPDVDKAVAHWGHVKEVFSRGVRWCFGVDVNQPDTLHLPDPLDNEARWETFLRGRFRGLWQGSLADFERFPRPKPEYI